jgi:hypothetical protein
MRLSFAALLLLPSFFLCAGAKADTVTYIETATASGSFGGTAFSGATITLTGIGNTSSIGSSGGIYSFVLPVSVQVSGISGTGVFTDQIQVVDNQSVPAAGFGDNSLDAAILFDSAAAFATYNLASSIGPIPGTSIINSGDSFGTTDGAFIINSASNVSFQAIVGTVSSVPEPSSLALLGTGVLGLAGMVHRRFATA